MISQIELHFSSSIHIWTFLDALQKNVNIENGTLATHFIYRIQDSKGYDWTIGIKELYYQLRSPTVFIRLANGVNGLKVLKNPHYSCWDFLVRPRQDDGSQSGDEEEEHEGK